ncbi:hypothetical protein I317_07001 [Kwoniella heveanensis CBS 569]|nr:hypothetical protein I317_07001 [Kwoniella heveanensis CBS 569]
MPPSTSPIILVLGAGPNIGHHVARTFAAGGYRVVLAARSVKEADSTDSQLNIPSDFTKVEDVVNAFERVKRVFGVPNVVVYNVSASTRTPPDEPFSLPLIDFQHDLTINITSLYVAAQQAVAGPTPTFIVTGNILNVETIPGFISQGVGKSAGAHMMWAAANAYNAKGYKFYYADERKADGTAKYRVDGDAHAQLSKSLAEDKSQREWHQTFVMGKGYQKFASSL